MNDKNESYFNNVLPTPSNNGSMNQTKGYINYLMKDAQDDNSTVKKKTSWFDRVIKLQDDSQPPQETNINNIQFEAPSAKTKEMNVHLKVTNPQEQGKIIAEEDLVANKVKNISSFQNALKGSSKVLFQLKTHSFPIDLEPTTIVIDCNKITIIKEDFLGNENNHAFNIEDLTDVILQTSFMFASLEMVDKNFKENTILIKNLKIDEARKGRRIMQGLMIASVRKIRISTFPVEELVLQLEQLGMSAA